MSQWTHCKYGVCGVDGAPGEKCELKLKLVESIKAERSALCSWNYCPTTALITRQIFAQGLTVLGLLKRVRRPFLSLLGSFAA